jgi:predicted RNA-binding protein with PUA-like domain
MITTHPQTHSRTVVKNRPPIEPTRWAWGELVAADRGLKPGEWAGVRNATASERKAVQVRRMDVCYSFLFQHCGAVLPLIVGQGTIGPFFPTMRRLDRAINSMIADKRIDTPDPYSTTVLAIAMAAAPGAHAELARIRDTMQCDRCSCILKDGGPLDPGSDQHAFIERDLRQSAFAREQRRHDS